LGEILEVAPDGGKTGIGAGRGGKLDTDCGGGVIFTSGLVGKLGGGALVGTGGIFGFGNWFDPLN